MRDLLALPLIPAGRRFEAWPAAAQLATQRSPRVNFASDSCQRIFSSIYPARALSQQIPTRPLHAGTLSQQLADAPVACRHSRTISAQPHLPKSFASHPARGSSMPAALRSRVHVFFCLVAAGLAHGLREAPAGEPGIRRQLLRAQQKFREAADAGEPAVQRSVEAELQAAALSPSRAGSASEEQTGACQPDLSRCPLGWASEGGMCVARGAYNGPCARSLSIGGLDAQGKAALARVCELTFPCRTASLRSGLGDERLPGRLPDVEGALLRGCGDSCLKLFHSLVDVAHDSGGLVSSNKTVSNDAALRQAALRSLEALHIAEQASALAANNSADALKLGEHDAMVSVHRGAELADTPCSTPAACAMKEREANRCNYARAALLSAYNDVNVLVHVLSAMVSTLCGCVHVQQVSYCVLHQVPQACVFPYTVYSKAFAGSVQLWEAVKASTNRCSVHVVHPSA